MSYTPFNYIPPNWVNETTPPISADNLLDMGDALAKLNISTSQLSSMNATVNDTLGDILKRFSDLIGQVAQLLDDINGEVV